MLEVTVIFHYDFENGAMHSLIISEYKYSLSLNFESKSGYKHVITSACVVPFLFVFEYWCCLKCTFSN